MSQSVIAVGGPPRWPEANQFPEIKRFFTRKWVTSGDQDVSGGPNATCREGQFPQAHYKSVQGLIPITLGTFYLTDSH